jgi:hypothetical protein
MALVLTGDGDITGLAVGALPSNVIGADTPAFSAYNNAATSLTQNVYTKIAFQVEEYDTANCYDNVTNYRFTPTVAGYYLVIGSFQVATTSGGMKLALYKNGSSYKLLGQAEPSTGFTYGSCIVYLNGSSDYIELYALQNQATQNTVVSSGVVFFQAAMIRGG